MRAEARASKIGASAGLFAALGEETRLRLVIRLCDEGPLSISELTKGTDVTRQAVTKHLRFLEEQKLVKSEKQGRAIVWEIESKRLQIARDYLDMISRRWDTALDRLKALVED